MGLANIFGSDTLNSNSKRSQFYCGFCGREVELQELQNVFEIAMWSYDRMELGRARENFNVI